MKHRALAQVALGLAAGATPALAQPFEPTIVGNAGASTDYVFRGVSQTAGGPQAFAGADLTAGPAYLGAWASNVDFGDGAEAELDLYGGWRPEVAGWTVDVGAIAYLYPGQPTGADTDYVEGRLGAARSFGRTGVALNAWWSPDFFGAAEDAATYVQGDLSQRLSDRWTASAALGRQAVSSDLDYTAWNIGVTWAVTDRFGLDLRWHDTDRHDLGDAYRARVVASAKTVF